MPDSVQHQNLIKGGWAARLVDRVAAETPPDRDRYLDFLRVAAILMVVLGHWVVRVVVAPEGEPQAGYLLAVEPGWQWASLIWQVMPVIFLVGGVLNARSWRRARADRMTSVGWIRHRARRLLRPTIALLVVVVPVWLAADLLASEALLIDPGVALIPLWFVAAYLAVTSMTPATLALHERGGTLPAIVAAVATAGLVDMLRLSEWGPVVGTQPLVGLPNFLLIWAAIHQMGHLWADDKLPARSTGQAGLVFAGAVALTVLIGLGGWPLTMVPVEGTELPNNAAPPTVALFALALVQTGLILIACGPMRRVLERAWFWTPVALLGARMLTLFLWHQVAMVAITNLIVWMGWFPLTETVDGCWWAQQPLWVLAFAVALAGFIAVAGRFEDAYGSTSLPDSGGWSATFSGIVLIACGVSGLLWLGVADMPPGLSLAFLALFLAGSRFLGAFGRHSQR